MKKLIFCLLFIFLFIQPVLAQQIPTLQKYVNDYANALSSPDETILNSLASQIEENTTIEIAILTVDTTGDMTIEEFAVETFEKNGIGKKDKDNGLLIVAAINDRKWRFEVGYGLEPILNDAKVGLIGRTYLTPAFREERYGDGFYDAVEAVYEVIQRSGDTSFISEQTDLNSVWILIFIIILFLVLLPLIIVLFSYERCPSCGTRMKCHEKGEYIICECPKCAKKIRKKKKRRFFWFFFVGGRGFGGGGSRGGGGGFGGGSSGGGGASGGW